MLTNDERPRAWWLAPQFKNINYRRAVDALAIIRKHPGRTAWELASLSGVVYADLSKGLQRGREYGLFRVESEERDAGGVRFRYWPSDTADAVVAGWQERGMLEEHSAGED